MRLLWAVDIFESHPKAIAAAAAFLKSLGSGSVKLEVHAVTVVGLSESLVPLAIRPEQQDVLLQDVNSLLADMLGKYKKSAWLKDQYALYNADSSQSSSVKAIIDHARKNKFDGIIAVKHSGHQSRKGFLGSFAEALVYSSPLPIYLVNPDWEAGKSIKKILVASDGTEESARLTYELSRYIPTEGTKTSVLFSLPKPFETILGDEVKDFVRDQEEAARKRMEPILEKAKKSGMKIDLEVQASKDSVEKSILKFAKDKKSDLIVMLQKNKGPAGFLLGRITRKILRETDRPILLVRPHS